MEDSSSMTKFGILVNTPDLLEKEGLLDIPPKEINPNNVYRSFYPSVAANNVVDLDVAYQQLYQHAQFQQKYVALEQHYQQLAFSRQLHHPQSYSEDFYDESNQKKSLKSKKKKDDENPGRIKRRRTNYKDPRNAEKLTNAVNVMLSRDGFSDVHVSPESIRILQASGLLRTYCDDDGNEIRKPLDLKSVARLFDVPYNTLRDNYLRMKLIHENVTKSNFKKKELLTYVIEDIDNEENQASSGDDTQSNNPESKANESAEENNDPTTESSNNEGQDTQPEDNIQSAETSASTTSAPAAALPSPDSNVQKPIKYNIPPKFRSFRRASMLNALPSLPPVPPSTTKSARDTPYWKIRDTEDKKPSEKPGYDGLYMPQMPMHYPSYLMDPYQLYYPPQQQANGSAIAAAQQQHPSMLPMWHPLMMSMHMYGNDFSSLPYGPQYPYAPTAESASALAQMAMHYPPTSGYAPSYLLSDSSPLPPHFFMRGPIESRPDMLSSNSSSFGAASSSPPKKNAKPPIAAAKPL